MELTSVIMILGAAARGTFTINEDFHEAMTIAQAIVFAKHNGDLIEAPKENGLCNLEPS